MIGNFIVTGKEYEECILRKQKLEKLEKAIEVNNDVIKINTKLIGKALELEDDYNCTFLFTM